MEDLQTLVDERLVSERKHPSAPLWIYNYTHKAQFQSREEWTPTLRQCRGLILNANGNVVERPFPKFFNLGEYLYEELPADGNWTAAEKYDGSLGVLYWVDGRPAIASRGSFTSDQALRGTAMLEDIYPHTWERFEPEYTYLFEVIYPDNRVVVDYGDYHALIHLTRIRKSDGADMGPDLNLGFPAAPSIYNGPLDIVLSNIPWHRDNAEGFVLTHESGMKIKVKHEEYVERHRLVTGFNAKRLWEYLRDGRGAELDELSQAATPAFKAWVDELRADIEGRFGVISDTVYQEAHGIPEAARKEQADYIKRCSFPALLFRHLDGKDFKPLAWRQVKPDAGYRVLRPEGE